MGNNLLSVMQGILIFDTPTGLVRSSWVEIMSVRTFAATEERKC